MEGNNLEGSRPPYPTPAAPPTSWRILAAYTNSEHTTLPRPDFGLVLVFLGGGTQDKNISKGHLPRVVYHQVYNVY